MSNQINHRRNATASNTRTKYRERNAYRRYSLSREKGGLRRIYGKRPFTYPVIEIVDMGPTAEEMDEAWSMNFDFDLERNINTWRWCDTCCDYH